MAVTYRTATAEDAEGVARVVVAGWHAAYPGLVPDALLAQQTVPHRTERFATIFADIDRARATWLAVEDGRVLGFGSQGPSRDGDAPPRTAEVYALYVLPDLWGQGLGRGLLERVMADAAELGLHRMSLWVLTANHPARRFYETLGFRDDLERAIDSHGFALQHTRMVRELSQA